MGRLGFSTTESARLLLLTVFGVLALSVVLAEQEGENLSGLSDNPDKAIFAVRENGTTCLMVEFAVRFLVPYDVLALNGIDLITEQAAFTLPRGAEIEGKCGSTESEIHITWKNNAYTLRIYFTKEFRDKGIEVWKITRVQFIYDTAETSHFINAYNRESPAEPMCRVATQHVSILPALVATSSSHINMQLESQLIHAGNYELRPRSDTSCAHAHTIFRFTLLFISNLPHIQLLFLLLLIQYRV
uniref:lysosome-associated membrane glycoprotein 5-like n=1 Tax=Solea senegalensis TaxID=28829 RepID=UPI001CD861AB|nr:lysosome-associated membrane glycoprotein 5-like [Solea senegalensis]